MATEMTPHQAILDALAEVAERDLDLEDQAAALILNTMPAGWMKDGEGIWIEMECIGLLGDVAGGSPHPDVTLWAPKEN